MSGISDKKRNVSFLLMLFAAFLVGSAVMSLEMLASRYLNPYFGGTIFTWAALISVVLLAMMAGYFLGGYSADKLKSGWVLEGMIILAAIYMVALPQFIDPMMEAVITAIEDVKIGALLGSLVVTALPVACLSTFTPIAIRRTLTELNHAGRISGTIFAISTAGNIFGTLLTSFYLIPNFGTRFLTQSLSIVLLSALAIVIIARPKKESASVAVLMFLALIVIPNVGGIKPAIAKSKTIIEKQAGYPEGPVFIGNTLYYTEMTRNRVMKLESAASKKKTIKNR